MILRGPKLASVFVLLAADLCCAVGVDGSARDMVFEIKAAVDSNDEQEMLSSLRAANEWLVDAIGRRAEPDSQFLVARKLVDPLRGPLSMACSQRNPGIRALAANLLQWATPSPQALEAVLGLIEDESDDVRAIGFRALALIGEESIAARATMVEQLDPDRPRQFAWAAAVIGGWRAPEGVPGLLRGLGSENLRVKRAAVKALGELGGRAKPGIPGLTAQMRLMRQREAEYREAAELMRAAIVKIDEKPQPADGSPGRDGDDTQGQ